MSKTFRPYDPDQQLLLPAALGEWPRRITWPTSSPTWWTSWTFPPSPAATGARSGAVLPTTPGMMVKVVALRLLHRSCLLAAHRPKRLHEDIAFRVLAANNTPDFRTISDFRKDHLSGVGRVVPAGAGPLPAGRVGEAGPRGAGRHQGQGQRVEAQGDELRTDEGGMREREEQLACEVDELLRRAQEVDEQEDRRYGREKRGDELPEELAFRESRLESRLRKIREAKAALEAEARAAAEQAESEGRNHPGVPRDKAQRNFTDPDSKIMPVPGGKDFQQSYNCQAVVDNAHQVILAARATCQPSDKGQAVAMVEEAIGNVGATPKEVSADAGYYSAQEVEELYALGVDPFVAPDRTRHGRGVATGAPGPHTRATCRPGTGCAGSCGPSGGRQRYGLRKETVEPVFGQIKQGRGFRQFLLRGLEKVNREWSLISTGHNLLKLFRFGASQSGQSNAQRPRRAHQYRAHQYREHQGGVVGRWRADYCETISPSASVNGRNGRRLIAAPAQIPPGNPRTGS